jgi:hypothetical protein
LTGYSHFRNSSEHSSSCFSFVIIILIGAINSKYDATEKEPLRG